MASALAEVSGGEVTISDFEVATSASITLPIEISEFIGECRPGSGCTSPAQKQFKVAVAQAASVNDDAVTIDGVESGSTIVHYTIRSQNDFSETVGAAAFVENVVICSSLNYLFTLFFEFVIENP